MSTVSPYTLLSRSSECKARRGELRNFTGIDSPYEAPLTPELHLRTDAADPVALADEVVTALLQAQKNGLSR